MLLVFPACGEGESLAGGESRSAGSRPKAAEKPKVANGAEPPEGEGKGASSPVGQASKGTRGAREAHREPQVARKVTPSGQNGEDVKDPVASPTDERQRGRNPEPQGAHRSPHGPVVSISRVVDGDTVEISPAIDGIDEVRLIGVDTPETSHPSYGEQPYGRQATSFAASRLGGGRVALEFDVERMDPYDRLLAYVWLPGDRMFNEALVRQGYAQVATFPPNVTYAERFRAAQREARQAGRGLWGLPGGQLCQQTDRGNGIGGGCPSGGGGAGPGRKAPKQQDRPSGGGAVAPTSENGCPSRAPIKGNDSSSGELIYHVPGGQYYGVTNPEECFATEAGARAAGYRASLR